jgi:ABC-type transporter Mla MlaB component
VASVLVDDRKGFAMEHPREVQRPLWSLEPPSVSVVAFCDGTRLTLDVHGEADRFTAGRMLAELSSALGPHLVLARVDLTDLAFCDLAGSDALHTFVEEAAGRGIVVELHGMSALLALIYSTFPPVAGAVAEDVLVGTRQGRISPDTLAGSVMT